MLEGSAHTDLRRGVVLLTVMLRLHEPHYGYSLRQALLKNGIGIGEGTLYPLLRRIEENGLLISHWRDHDGRSRRYYVLTDAGVDVRDKLVREWRSLTSIVNQCIVDQEGTSDGY